MVSVIKGQVTSLLENTFFSSIETFSPSSFSHFSSPFLSRFVSHTTGNFYMEESMMKNERSQFVYVQALHKRGKADRNEQLQCSAVKH